MKPVRHVVVVFLDKPRRPRFGRPPRRSLWRAVHRPGFGHCFVAIRTRAGWVGLDPLAHWSLIEATGAPTGMPGPTLCRLYVEQSRATTALHLIVREPPRRPALPWPATCAELVRRAIGAPLVLPSTPWRLYRALLRHPGLVMRYPQ